MEAILIKPELRELLLKDAEQEQRSVSDIVNEAVEHYLHDRQTLKLDQEIAAFERLHPDLVKTHLGKWVAVFDQQLVDHDQERQALYQRVRAKYGRATILIRRVLEQPVEELWIRTPSTGKISQ